MLYSKILRRRNIIAVSIFSLLIFLAVFYADRITASVINRFTPYFLSYDKWGKSFVDRRDIYGLKFGVKGKNLAFTADKARLTPDTHRSFKDKAIIATFDADGVALCFSPKGNAQKASSGNMIEALFSLDHKYDKVVFTAILDKKSMQISDFKVDSDDVKMTGKCIYYQDGSKLKLYLNVSCSQKVYDLLPDDIRAKLLSPSSDGWYGTVIDYTGPAALLRLLF